jgi:hypothetical protein
VVAIPPAYTTQDCSGILPDGSPCGERIQQSLSMRTHVCPRCGLMLDRDHNAAKVILQRGLAVARADGRWPPETRDEWYRGAHGNRNAWGQPGFCGGVRALSVAPAGGSKNLSDLSGKSVKRYR